MHRSSSRKDLRAERLGQSPYSRSGNGERHQLKRSALSSLVSFVSAPFRRLGNDGADAEAQSVSGSEDGWNGEPPATMRGQDVFSLASAAGREGAAFEARAEAWRADKGLLNKSVARGFPSSNSQWGLDLEAGASKSHLPYSPSLPSMQTPQSRQPKATGTPQAANAASRAALRAFLEAKGDTPMKAQDYDVIDSLTRNIKSEGSAPDVGLGGWSAGTNAGTPSKSRTVFQPHSPSVSTPGTSFSLGSTAVRGPTGLLRKRTYLGPGMSPRRAHPLRSAATGLGTSVHQATPKKRRVYDDIVVEDVTDAPSASSPPTGSAAVAEAVAASFNAKARSSLNRSSSAASPRPVVTRASQKRAADIMREVIDAEIGSLAEPSPSITVNPYEDFQPALPSGKHTSVRSSLRKSTSAMRLSLRSSTPSRGAAEQIERLRGTSRPLTTLEMVSSYKQQEGPADVEMSDDEPEVVSPPPPTVKKAPKAPAPAPEPVQHAPSAMTVIPEATTYKSLSVPTHTSSTIGSAPSTIVKPAQEASSALTDSILSASKTPTPTFEVRSVGIGAPPPAASSSAPRSFVTRATSRRVDPTAIYLSSKDSALSTDKAALPFYTFTVSPTLGGNSPSEEVKEKARARPVEHFEFSLPTSAFLPPASRPAPSDAPKVTAPSAAVAKAATPKAAEWTCDLCGLQNPDSAKEKCTVCEEKRPGATPAPAKAPATMPAAPSGGFSFGAAKPASASAAEWTCDLCGLQNPDSAKEQCTICEAKRPGDAPATAGGFSFGAKPAAPAAAAGGAEWECSVCMLMSPDSAKEKCIVCEAPRPGASASASSAAPPPALPAVPTGGFSFGGKPVSAPSSDAPPAPPSGGFSFGGAPAAPSAPFSFGGKPLAASSSKAAAAPASGGFGFPGAPAAPFSFGAMPAAKPAPAASSGPAWTCDTCMLENPDSAKETCTICEAPRPGAAAAAPAKASGFAMPSAPSGGFSFGAKPSAPKPAATAGAVWTCDTCMLENPASATEKCTICDAPRP